MTHYHCADCGVSTVRVIYLRAPGEAMRDLCPRCFDAAIARVAALYRVSPRRADPHRRTRSQRHETRTPLPRVEAHDCHVSAVSGAVRTPGTRERANSHAQPARRHDAAEVRTSHVALTSSGSRSSNEYGPRAPGIVARPASPAAFRFPHAARRGYPSGARHEIAHEMTPGSEHADA
jgi:hypothetical protein